MPTGTSANIRVHIPDLKAEIGIDCQLHDSFWHLKLCLVDSLVSTSGQLAGPNNAQLPRSIQSTACRSRPFKNNTLDNKENIHSCVQKRHSFVSATWGRKYGGEFLSNSSDGRQQQKSDGYDNSIVSSVSQTDLACNSSRLFEQLISSGYMNYGASYYLDLEFKLKQRQQAIPSLSSIAYTNPPLSLVINKQQSCSNNSAAGLTKTASARITITQQDYFGDNDEDADEISNYYSNHLNKQQQQIKAPTRPASKLSRLSFSSLTKTTVPNTGNNNFRHSTISLTSSTTAAASHLLSEKQTTNVNNTGSLVEQRFANNMIAKLASNSTGGHHSQKSTTSSSTSAQSAATTAAMTSSQSKKKRSKLLDLLLNTNWSKQSQQANNLQKLNKMLLVCDANFLDEKTGESPLSLAISLPQTNSTPSSASSHRSQSNGFGGGGGVHHYQSMSIPSTIGCPQSTSLFNLQCQSTASHNQLTLQQTSVADICQSKAPLVERILLLLIKSGALVDFRNNDGRTPLHVAAMKSNFWALKTLLDLGASNDYRDINGLTPLYYSILHKAELKVTQLLLNHNNRNPSSHHHLAATAANNSDNKTVGNVGITDQHGWQEVHHACKLGLDAHLDKLLYNGCDIDAKISGSGNTPLHVAAINDQLNCAKVLLLRGADKTITNNSHQTAHQVAVIANNMELAEFIAEHDDSKVVPFDNDRAIAGFRTTPSMAVVSGSQTHQQQQQQNNKLIHRLSITNAASPSTPQPTQLVNSRSVVANLGGQNSSFPQSNQSSRMGIVHPQPQQQQLHTPLTVEIQQHQQLPATTTNSMRQTTQLVVANNNSANQQHLTMQAPHSLLSLNTLQHHSQQLNVQVNNISPSLSQRSCATSTNTTTTSSSGVCCDGDGNNSTEELAHSRSQYSNITVISIGKDSATKQQQHYQQQQIECDPAKANSNLQHQQHLVSTTTSSSLCNGNSNLLVNAQSKQQQQTVDTVIKTSDPDKGEVEVDNDDEDDDDDDDFRSSESSSNGLQSLMSEDRPLFIGSFVVATSEYQSGDPSHLQLRRNDLIEVLEYPVDMLQADGQLPRIANKPLLFGRRQLDGQQGLFPSFCVRRSSRQQRQRTGLRQQRGALNDLTNTSRRNTIIANGGSVAEQSSTLSMPASHSMISLNNKTYEQKMIDTAGKTNLGFKEIQVTLTKLNGGFGFVLRGARIDPATLAAQNQSTPTSQSSGGKIPIDERLIAANNLASLQYLDDIEPDSVAYKAGLKRGDFLVAVNGQDVRLCSHEQVVSVIRQSGDQVHLTIATPVQQSNENNIYSQRTLTRVKPKPPTRDPTTTLSRNKTIKSMSIAPQQQQQFDADKPLPQVPHFMNHGSYCHDTSPTNSLGTINRSISTNLSHFQSAQSLSSGVPDTQSISSISTVGSTTTNEQQHQHFQNANVSASSGSSIQLNNQHRASANQSSSSTTTLTTVATKKPEAPAKPNEIHLKAAKLAAANNYNGSNGGGSNYQPAIITTNRLRSSPGQSSLNSPTTAPPPPPPPPPPPLPEFSSNCIETTPLNGPTNATNSNFSTKVQLPPPPPPPPPPPLPESPVTQSENRLMQRRISAPTSQSIELIDRNRLLKKRESLAAVKSSPSSQQQQPVGSCQLSAVAAACAAAANDRMQRQQQQQQQMTELAKDDSLKANESKPANKIDQNSSSSTMMSKVDNVEKIAATPDNSNNKENFDEGEETPKAINQPLKIENQQQQAAVAVDEKNVMIKNSHVDVSPMNGEKNLANHRSATISFSLGRKTSAQIIQQPKHNHPSQSQTLRAKPKRPAIPSYDSPFPPPPQPAVDRQQNLDSNENLESDYHEEDENFTTDSETAYVRHSRELHMQQLKQQQQLILRQQQQQQLRQQQHLLQHQSAGSARAVRQNHCYSATIARGGQHECGQPVSTKLMHPQHLQQQQQQYQQPQQVQMCRSHSHHRHQHHRDHDHAQAQQQLEDQHEHSCGQQRAHRQLHNYGHHKHQHHHHHHDHDELTMVAALQQQQQQQCYSQHHNVLLNETREATQRSTPSAHNHHHQQQLIPTNANQHLMQCAVISQDNNNRQRATHHHHHNHHHNHQTPQQHLQQRQIYTNQNQQHQIQHQQQLYGQLQQQQFIERYLPLVYTAESQYSATLDR